MARSCSSRARRWVVAALSPCGGSRGQVARRRRRGPAGPKSGRRRPGAATVSPEGQPVTGGSCAALESAHPARSAYQDRRPAWARRASRALEAVKKVLTDTRLQVAGLSDSD